MFLDDEIIAFCIRNGISVQQYFFMYLLARKDFHQTYEKSMAKRYIHEIEKFKPEDIEKLVEKGFLQDFNSPGEYYPDLFMLDERALKFFVTEDYAEELWNKYPPTLPLSNGASFVARAGAEKEDLLEEYRKKIDYSGPKHKYVMEQLDKYIKLVRAGKINGHKISDWVRMEVWTTIDDMTKEENESGFGQDI